VRRKALAWALACLFMLHGVPGVSAAEESSVQDILAILKDRGIIDEAEYGQLSAKNAAYEKQHEGWKPNIQLSGDLRVRHESFWFDEDRFSDRPNRFRGRYRIRLNASGDVNDWVSAHLRLASGDDPLSTNVSFGEGGSAFAPDPITIHRAFVRVRPFGGDRAALGGIGTTIEAGRVGMPFTWEYGKDFLLWDGDINLGGTTLKADFHVNEALTLFGNTGYYIVDENSSRKDPHMFHVQVGAHAKPVENVAFGTRFTYFTFRSVDTGFLAEGASFGNIGDFLASTSTGQSGIDVGEVSAYVQFSGIEGWPMLLYGTFARNFDARSIPGASEENQAWGLGAEVGDKRKLVRLGAGYFRLEANAFPGFSVDSDLFDSRTNRKGWIVYGSRELRKNMDLNLTLFASDPIRKGGTFERSVSGGDRFRLQTDLVVKF
jgi:hypothetical protein